MAMCARSEWRLCGGRFVADEIFRSEFGLAFMDAKTRCNARARHGSFDLSVLEIDKEDLKMFLETLCERH